jgi:hypothetical protein
MRQSLPLLAGALAIAWAMSGCITINIYFPAAAAEKAADRIIDEVLGKGSGAAPSTPAKP